MTTTATQELAGKRLDTVVGTMILSSSRNQIQKLIKDGSIMVNGKKVLPHHFLKEGDEITVLKTGSGIDVHHTTVLSPARTPRIVAETPDYIIIDKPSGIVVHPAPPSSRSAPTLIDWLLIHYPEIRKIGDDLRRPGIVHRLDKDASGVMVVARTQESFESLVRQFKLRQVKKEYRILVYGHVTPNEGVIDLPIGRSKKLYTKRAAHVNEGRTAVTRYVVLEEYKQTSLVRVIPETGRTHQIRVHFFAKGNPIVGDTLYISKKIKPISATRLMLHAEHIGFRNFSGEWKEYSVPPDVDFENNLANVRAL